MAKRKMEVQGLREMGQVLRQLPRDLASKNGGPIRKALNAAVDCIEPVAETLAPKQTGRLTRAVYRFRDRNPRALGLTERYIIGVRRGKLVKQNVDVSDSFGIGIKMKRTKASLSNAGLKDDEAPYGRFVEFGTSNSAAQPFLRPAFDMNWKAAANKFRDQLGIEVAKVCKKYDRRMKRVKRNVR
jgi:HK97 gp10 family phage protein